MNVKKKREEHLLGTFVRDDIWKKFLNKFNLH